MTPSHTPAPAPAAAAGRLRALRRKEVTELTGLSATRIFELERAGQFPHHTMFGPRVAAWLQHEVEEWIAARFAERSVGKLAPTRGGAR